MAQWYAQLVFKGDIFFGDGQADWEEVNGLASIENSTSENSTRSDERHTIVIVSGYALYGQLRGYYALGVAHILVDPTNGQARYLSERSARHHESVDSLTPAQRAAIREWLIGLNRAAWENSTEPFRRSLS